MKQIYVHGLGQTAASWESVLCRLEKPDECICPDLAGMIPAGETATYQALYKAFMELCDSLEGPLDLCGLSLGGVLALHYASEHPERVHSLVLIAPQYRMPKGLLRMQNILFRFFPKAAFSQVGFTKSQFIQLCGSMMDLDLSEVLSEITCPTLVLCGSRDRANKQVCVQLAQRLKRAELQIVDDAGHEINREAPEQLAALLCNFYSKIP